MENKSFMLIAAPLGMLAFLTFVLLLCGCSDIQKRLYVDAEWAGERIVEDVIKQETGISL